MMILQVRVYEHLILTTYTETTIDLSITPRLSSSQKPLAYCQQVIGSLGMAWLSCFCMRCAIFKSAIAHYLISYYLMFPTSLEHPYQQSRGRRRGRNQPNNRDYICPCGKSYLSYPALFTHIKIKHNGRAPGQVIKPRSEYANRRGRPKAKQVYDSDSDTEDIAANCIDRLCDFVSDTEKWDDDGTFKEIYMKSDFYEVYVNFNPQEQEPKYDESEELYDQTCANVFCQFLAEINKRLTEPYYFDILFTFFMMLARSIDEDYSKEDKESEYEVEVEEEDNSSSQKNVKRTRVEVERIRNVINIINPFMTKFLPKYKKEYDFEKIPLFFGGNAAKLIEHFFTWLTNKKYLAFKIKINENFVFADK